MIVVHIDTTTDGHSLVACYTDRKETDTILVNPTKEEVKKVLAEKPNETLMCLGHGSPSGLFGASFGNVIDGTIVNLLKDREMIGIWCHAKEFGRRYGLKGFFTSMFVSNPSEASWYSFKKVSEEVTQEQNTIFSKKVNDLIKNDVPLADWISNLQDYDRTLDFVCFNYENFEYFDGTQKAEEVKYSPLVLGEDTDYSDSFGGSFWGGEFMEDTNEGIIADMGRANDTMRDCISRLRLNMGFGDTIDVDGDTITKEQLDKWEETLNEIDRYCYYV